MLSTRLAISSVLLIVMMALVLFTGGKNELLLALNWERVTPCVKLGKLTRFRLLKALLPLNITGMARLDVTDVVCPRLGVFCATIVSTPQNRDHNTNGDEMISQHYNDCGIALTWTLLGPCLNGKLPILEFVFATFLSVHSSEIIVIRG